MDIRRCCKSGRAVFRLIRKASLREFLRCPLLKLFHVWTLLSAKGMFSGSDVPRGLNQTSTAFYGAFISNSLSCATSSAFDFQGAFVRT